MVQTGLHLLQQSELPSEHLSDQGDPTLLHHSEF
uniref:Uncharacterized protein n=1 Tax=Nelumbo nucifera TaxID=4432 RepID=A0A822XGZ1_NELNU|nr:TPA_asm: hypothetical protein HUJ06_019558 [Nelumbo nucifera]